MEYLHIPTTTALPLGLRLPPRRTYTQATGTSRKNEGNTSMNFPDLDRITIDPRVMGGKPCIRGIRITVGTITGLLASRESSGRVLDLYPSLEREDIYAALGDRAGERWNTADRPRFPAFLAAIQKPFAFPRFPCPRNPDHLNHSNSGKGNPARTRSAKRPVDVFGTRRSSASGSAPPGVSLRSAACA